MNDIDHIPSEVQDLLSDSVAMLAVAKSYLDRRNYSRAMEWLRKLESMKVADAYFWEAWCFAYGHGVVQNIELANSKLGRFLAFNDAGNVTAAEMSSLADHIESELNDRRDYGFHEEPFNLMDKAAHLGDSSAAVFLGGYFLNDCYARDYKLAVKYLYPHRKDDREALNLLLDAYMHFSPKGIRKLNEQGLYDETVVPEWMRHPRYWLSGKTLVVKKFQYDDWISFERFNGANKGYYSVLTIKKSWIRDCLEEMTDDDRRQYFASIGEDPNMKEPYKDVWDMEVVDGDKRYRVIVPVPPSAGGQTKLEEIL